MNRTFLKWAGNVTRALPHLIPHIGYPKRYCEPCGGRLAVALNAPAEQYILNDVNKDLVAIYQNFVNSFYTRATAAPLIYPTGLGKVVAVWSRWGSAEKKNPSNQLLWLECWLAHPTPTLKNQAQPGVVE